MNLGIEGFWRGMFGLFRIMPMPRHDFSMMYVSVRLRCIFTISCSDIIRRYLDAIK